MLPGLSPVGRRASDVVLLARELVTARDQGICPLDAFRLGHSLASRMPLSDPNRNLKLFVGNVLPNT